MPGTQRMLIVIDIRGLVRIESEAPGGSAFAALNDRFRATHIAAQMSGAGRYRQLTPLCDPPAIAVQIELDGLLYE